MNSEHGGGPSKDQQLGGGLGGDGRCEPDDGIVGEARWSTRFPNYAVVRLASTVAAKAATKLLILTLAAAMLAVLLSPMPAAAMLVMLLSLSPLRLRSP
ncbi:hypothetical protein PHYSODRAFT_334660 [Phytophthora sojae]|uniref:Uncharacterized protein n=1 Tax=Phytophthora sojae (strain P6497) TaxID=1094619 RepID=G4ZST0_PHYSP|nr:hypothetical protein PHYSODRAFT_334660 [Phytophthora sojae]EGZ12801.1 hypothetical protein PHYSODRAFT_334660 [Phytophthora sojae]|eukprot:XP_009530230.1 hypothetical protein PHYSODRAFT_334660 [Phytophthora sojae]